MESTLPNRSPRIAIVDDETGILNALRRELNTPPFGHHRWEVELFSDPRAALARAREQEFDIVLSDYRMPEMDGLEMLKGFAALQPDCVRIVLSGQTDFSTLISMINQTHIYRFISKPWERGTLLSVLSQAAWFGESLRRNRRMTARLRESGLLPGTSAAHGNDRLLVVHSDASAARKLANDIVAGSGYDDLVREFDEAAQQAPLQTVFRGPFDDLLRMVLTDGHGGAPALDPQGLTIDFAGSGDEALELASRNDYACVIADSAGMAGMDANSFLARFTGRQPDCTAILITDSNDMKVVTQALELAHITAVLIRPFVNYDLRTSVAQSLARRRFELENLSLAKTCRDKGLSPDA